jgi:cell division protein ZapA
MSHVTVTIAGRAYRMACDPGQEEHLFGLARVLDGKIDQLRSSFGEIGEMRLAVMAAITVADELAEAQRRIEALETEIEGLRSEAASTTLRDDELKARLARAVDEAAARMERMAETLERNSG